MSNEDRSLAVHSYAPGYFEIKARHIEEWSEKSDARELLAVLIRKLVVTTSEKVTKSDFPGYENSQRPGWDGQVRSNEATPWIPLGNSGWEFGVNKGIKKKADADFANRTERLPVETRRDTTFVFVTPRNWRDKNMWVAAKQKENEWKDVRAYDASDLEQWLERSIPSQAWLADRIGKSHPGIRSVDHWWKQWLAVCSTNLAGAIAILFEKPVKVHEPKIRKWLATDPDEPLVIAADSAAEALAFTVKALRSISYNGISSADRAIVVTQPSALPMLSSGVSNFVALVNSPQVELDLGELPKFGHTIVTRHKGSMPANPDVSLGIVPTFSFVEALTNKGYSRNKASYLSRKTGNSITILRRCESKIPEVRHPLWARDINLRRELVPLTLIGTWRADLNGDVKAIKDLTGEPFKESEVVVKKLLEQPDPPVWTAGKYRGMVAQLDTLEIVAPYVIEADLVCFFKLAKEVLSEEDPALDLPESVRWLAKIYGKTRNTSPELRQSLCGTLVLLATRGHQLFRDTVEFDLEERVNRLIRELLTPLTSKVWDSQRGILPSLAEAAPGEFLRLLEEDLKEEEPTVLTLFRPPIGRVPGDCPRTELLWALEALAWKPERLYRVVEILANLSRIDLDDRWENKPINSLKAIFRSWLPQTAANVQDRKLVLTGLIGSFPEIAWKLCADQFSSKFRTGHYNYSPRFRNDALQAGGVASDDEIRQFTQHVVDIAIEWSQHDTHTLGDLVKSLRCLQEDDQLRVWNLIDSWCRSTSEDTEKAVLRETIRQHALTQHSQNIEIPELSQKRAQEIYDNLAPSNLINKHQWLFAQPTLKLLEPDIVDRKFDYETGEKKIVAKRVQAVEEIWLEQGLSGILELLGRSRTPFEIGECLKDVVTKSLDDVVSELISYTGSVDAQRIEICLTGLLASQEGDVMAELLKDAVSRFLDQKVGEDELVLFLCCAPFRKSVWEWAPKAGESVRKNYWQTVIPHWFPDAVSELENAIDELLIADKPREALSLIEIGVELITSERIVRILRGVAINATNPLDQLKYGNSDLYPFSIQSALAELAKRKAVSRQELARLEMPYISVLTRDSFGIPHLERELASSPHLFIHAVSCAFPSSEGDEDPVAWCEYKGDMELREARMDSFLRSARVTPGTLEDGSVSRTELMKWVKEARQLCLKYKRGEEGDKSIGMLLSNSPIGTDGIWPCEAVRDALEETRSEDIKAGMIAGVENLRGVTLRGLGDGGDQERDLAEKYRNWQHQVPVTYWFTIEVLKEIARRYDKDASNWDKREIDRSRTRN